MSFYLYLEPKNVKSVGITYHLTSIPANRNVIYY